VEGEIVRKFFVRWLIYFVCIFIVAYFLELVTIDKPITLVLAALILGILNAWIRPIIKFVTLPLNFMTLGLFSLVINTFLLWLTSVIVPGLGIEGILKAFIASICISVLSSILNWLIGEDSKFRIFGGKR